MIIHQFLSGCQSKRHKSLGIQWSGAEKQIMLAVGSAPSRDKNVTVKSSQSGGSTEEPVAGALSRQVPSFCLAQRHVVSSWQLACMLILQSPLLASMASVGAAAELFITRVCFSGILWWKGDISYQIRGFHPGLWSSVVIFSTLTMFSKLFLKWDTKIMYLPSSRQNTRHKDTWAHRPFLKYREHIFLLSSRGKNSFFKWFSVKFFVFKKTTSI